MNRVVLECVVNISEGRDLTAIAAVAAAADPFVLDIHSDADHHRSVITTCGPEPELSAAVAGLARSAVAKLDLARHEGAHPRFGVVDVVPWVNLVARPGGLADGSLVGALAARDRFATWAASELGLPCYLYGPSVSLPDLRRALREADRDPSTAGPRPDFGPSRPHPTAGRCAVGARGLLVAYNLWLADADVAAARRIAAAVRAPGLRTLGLQVGGRAQVSCNLVEPFRLGPGIAFDAVAVRAALERTRIERAELVGLLPRAVLEAEPHRRWGELGISPAQTIEARLEAAGLDGGRFS